MNPSDQLRTLRSARGAAAGQALPHGPRPSLQKPLHCFRVEC